MLSGGLGGNAGFWQPQMQALGERFRVLAYDHRGTGRNAGPLPAGHGIADMAEDVLGMLDEAGIARCHFVGHAVGALIGLQLALLAPERLGRLALVNGWAAPNPHTRRCFDARRAVLKSGGPSAYAAAQPIFLYPPAWCVEHAARVEAEVAHAAAHFQGEANLLLRIDALLSFDVASQLGRIAHPTWVAASRDDVLVPWTCSRRLADGLPNAHLHVVETGGHAFTATEPEAFNRALVDFLGG